jgi:ribosomal protein L12E/L44/L45/RPP1/RPP2
MRVASLIIGLLMAGTVWADIGSVTETSGTAIIKRGKDTIQIAKGTLVETNDKIETKNGKVKIVFKDDTNVVVTESSSLIIDDFVYDPKSGAGKLGLKAAAGTVRYVSGSIAKDPKNVKINTPTAAIAVRGTDFVMAVSETGASMIMLMPTCEIEQNVNLKGLICGSGAIDVETPAGIVKLNRPYQATLVETLNGMPSPAVIVALNGMAIGNNLMVNPPKTTTGLSVVAAARAAAEKTGDAKKGDNKDKKEEKDDKDDAKDQEKQAVAGKQDGGGNRSQRQGRSANEGDEDTANGTKVGVDTLGNKDGLANEIAAVGDTDNPYVKKLFKDKSETQQVGWMYESLSPNSRNYANVVMPINTQVQVVVTQDMQTNSWNFSSGKAVGQIVINQNFR